MVSRMKCHLVMIAAEGVSRSLTQMLRGIHKSDELSELERKMIVALGKQQRLTTQRLGKMKRVLR